MGDENTERSTSATPRGLSEVIVSANFLTSLVRLPLGKPQFPPTSVIRLVYGACFQNHMTIHKIESLLWITRMCSVLFTLLYIVPVLDGNPYSCYQRALISNAATSALRLHQRMPSIQLSRMFLSQLLIEDSCHYLFYSLIFLFAQPMTLVLLPVFLFSLLHSASFSLTLLDKFGGRSGFLGTWLVNLLEHQGRNILRLVAFTEIFLMPLTIFSVLSETYIEREAGESANDRNDRAIRTSVNWYCKHLENRVDIVLLTNDEENRCKAQEQGLKACTLAAYVRSLRDHPGLLDKLAKLELDASAVRVLDYLPLSKYMNLKRCVAISAATLHLGIKSGRFEQGKFQASRDNYLEGSVVLGDDEESRSVLIQGRSNLNRAVHEDQVVVEIFPEDKWSLPSGLVLVDETQDDEDKTVRLCHVAHGSDLVALSYGWE
ncbi:hypothetical protein HPB48_014844 [Haemaphysalis longicornis]|uniref:Uncharacterized protein n=1 Tax=Haemaphysalis longicornis TaxID=44386 RepID=A0A9J6GFK2_HAELO|nr:hypothetical protein HPB48_014844 [Haemaphysalis longicornis]